VGAVVSSWTSWLEMLETLPTLSSVTHLIVVVPSAVTFRLGLAALNVGAVGPGLLVHVAYFVAMGVTGRVIAARRLGRLLLT